MRNLLARSTVRALAPLVLVAAVTLDARAQTAGCETVVNALTCSGTLGGGPLFDSPLFSPLPNPPGSPPVRPTEQVNAGNVFYFSSFVFAVTQTGAYDLSTRGSFTFELDPNITGGQPALFLYVGAFNPLSPLQNIVFGATTFDFDNNLMVPVRISLAAQTPYTLVTSSVFSRDIGPFQTSCGPALTNQTGRCFLSTTDVVPEPSTVTLSASGLLVLAFAARRRRSARMLRG